METYVGWNKFDLEILNVRSLSVQLTLHHFQFYTEVSHCVTMLQSEAGIIHSNFYFLNEFRSDYRGRLKYDQRFVHHSNEICNILGGIDQVVATLLTSPYFTMQTEQQERLRHYTDRDYQPKQLIWSLDPTNYCLYKCSPRFHGCIFHKWTVGMLVFISTGWIVVYIVAYEYSLIIGIFVLFPLILWCIAALLCVNQIVLRLVLKSPMFWAKQLIVVIFAICHLPHAIHTWRDNVRDSVLIVNEALFLTFCIIAVTLLCCVDGLTNFSHARNVKVMAIGFTAFALFIGSWMYELGFVPKTPLILDFVFGLKFNVTTNLISSMRSLCLFFVIQTFGALRNKDRCSALSYSPYLDWSGNIMDTKETKPELCNLPSNSMVCSILLHLRAEYVLSVAQESTTGNAATVIVDNDLELL